MGERATIHFRHVLLSTGEITMEAVISLGPLQVSEACPVGLTSGSKEPPRFSLREVRFPVLEDYVASQISGMSQIEFDDHVVSLFDESLRTALSLAFVRFRALADKHVSSHLFRHIASSTGNEPAIPRPISNILNGGAHARSKLSFCEFMVIPNQPSFPENLQLLSRIYLHLGEAIQEQLGARHTLSGREGGYAPELKENREALKLITKAIEQTGSNTVQIAIDVAANEFCSSSGKNFLYLVDGERLTTRELKSYYLRTIEQFPLVKYLEDPFHENDLDGWADFRQACGNDLLIVADDLVCSQLCYMTEHADGFNACVLKPNQAITFSNLLKASRFCVDSGIPRIVAHRSGETDSNLLAHVAVGLGADYIKIGAPARERIVKYNELVRIDESLKQRD